MYICILMKLVQVLYEQQIRIEPLSNVRSSIICNYLRVLAATEEFAVLF